MRILVFHLEHEDEILRSLRKAHPTIGFRKCRVDENIDDEGNRLIVIDTVSSIRSVMLLDSLESGYLKESRAISNLRIMKRLGAIESVKVIAVPESIDATTAMKAISSIIVDFGSGG